MGVMEQAAQADGLVFHYETAFDVVDHLGDGNRILIDVEDGTLAHAVKNVLKYADEVDGVGGDLLIEIQFVCSSLLRVASEVLHAWVGPGGLFDLLLLLEHLGGGFEALVLEETLDEFAAWIFGLAA